VDRANDVVNMRGVRQYNRVSKAKRASRSRCRVSKARPSRKGGEVLIITA
jgi:hypothetical protein